jgi:hypothetical protein
MAVTEAYAGSEAVAGTEWSMTTDTAGPDVTAVAGVYQPVVDLSDMVTGDELQFRVYEKAQAGDTQRVLLQLNLVGPQSPADTVFPAMMLINGWDMTLKAIAGTITVTWSIRKG